MSDSKENTSAPVVVWFRQDLRVDDNPALADAAKAHGGVIPVFILEEAGEGPFASWGGASRSWLHHSLTALAESLEALGSRLILRRGEPREIIPAILRETKADGVYWNRRYEPHSIKTDSRLKETLRRDGFTARSFNASLLWEPRGIRNKSGEPFKVFTPFWKHCRQIEVEPPVKAPASLPVPATWPRSDRLDEWALRPRKPEWDRGFYELWTPGETGAVARLRKFAGETVASYGKNRDLPADAGTSRLSPHLHWGEIGPRQIWAEFKAAADSKPSSASGVEVYLREIGWREFAHHVLFHFPDTPVEPLRPEFAEFPWKSDAALLRRWQKGRTGYPIVDAGMRELWRTGWMHNRVRMIVGSFLVKHLLQPWQEGAAWFWDTLVDANLANNTMGWQWTAGCGADAAPYFRIFNPMLQGKKFDPEGEYVKRWVPELAKLSADTIHEPWTASADHLLKAGVTLGTDYPLPVVDHAQARKKALAAFEEVKKR